MSAIRARAQASPLVPLDARVYQDIDQLAAAGLIDTIIVGTRPYTAREVARLLSEARRNLGRRPADVAWQSEIIAADLLFYAPHLNRPIDDARAEVASMSSPYRPIPTDGNGSIDATINPLAAYRGGRPLADGSTATLETSHSVILGSHFAASVDPRFTGERFQGDSGGAELRLQSGSASGLFGNFRIDAGRAEVQFGQAPTGGLLLSANSPPLDMIRVTNDRPAALPSFLRYLGPLQGTLFVADLGTSNQIFPHSKLVGWHVSMLPTRRVELGAAVIDETGGSGAPPASFADRVEDVIPLIDAIFRTRSDFLFSNKLAGVDARVRVPELAGLTIYGEGVVDDFDVRRLRSSLLDDGGYIGGLYFACILQCGRFGLRAEYHQTGIRFYTHTQFSSGVQRDGVIVGDPLGPRGLGEYVTLDAQGNRYGTVSLATAYEIRSGNLYGSVTDSGGVDFRFVQLLHRPGERRGRAVLSWRSGAPSASLTLTASAGLEGVSNFEFVQGRDRTNGLAQLQLEFRW